MTDEQNRYYKTMRDRGRLIPTMDNNGRLCAILTFFIGDDDSRYIRDNPWTVLEDNEMGKTVYIDQLISKQKFNPRTVMEGWRYIREYFKCRFPQIEKIKWARKGRVKTYELHTESLVKC